MLVKDKYYLDPDLGLVRLVNVPLEHEYSALVVYDNKLGSWRTGVNKLTLQEIPGNYFIIQNRFPINVNYKCVKCNNEFSVKYNLPKCFLCSGKIYYKKRIYKIL